MYRLESRGEYDKAAGLALFHGAAERAIRALGSARGRDHKDGKIGLLGKAMKEAKTDKRNLM